MHCLQCCYEEYIVHYVLLFMWNKPMKPYVVRSFNEILITSDKILGI